MARKNKTDATATAEAAAHLPAEGAAHLPAEGATANANMSNRRAVIKATYLKLCELEAARKEIGAEIAALKAKHVKGDLGMKIGDFNIAVRLAGLEGDDRDQCMDTMRETFEALGLGQQLNWLDAAPDAPKADSAPKAGRSKKAKAVERAQEGAKVYSFAQELRDTAQAVTVGDDDVFGDVLDEDGTDPNAEATEEELELAE